MGGVSSATGSLEEGQANSLKDRLPEGIPRRHRRAQSRNRTEEQRNAKEDNNQTLVERNKEVRGILGRFCKLRDTTQSREIGGTPIGT